MKERLFRFLWSASGRRPSLDALFTHHLKHRQHLRVVEAKLCIPRFDESEILLRSCPVGAWSTPLIDVFVLIKAVVGFESKRILELGSYRGDTARMIAENTRDFVRICTVDVSPEHGSSYQNTPIAARIDRKTGEITPKLFSRGEKYDFIFVDANHDFNSVVNDTYVALDLLSEEGVIFWHDYHFKDYFHGMSGVPEALKHFSANHSIISVSGTTLAMCSRYPGWETSKLLEKSAIPGAKRAANVWHETQMRG